MSLAYQPADVRRQTSGAGERDDRRESCALGHWTFGSPRRSPRAFSAFRAARGDLSELELTCIEVSRLDFERNAREARQVLTEGQERALSSLQTRAGSRRSSRSREGSTVARSRLNCDTLIRIASHQRPDRLAAEADRERARVDA